MLHVKNKFHFREKIENDGGGAVNEKGLSNLPRVGSVTQSLRSRLFKFGRIEPNHEHEKTGLADVEVKFGWESYNNGTAHLRSYIGGVFPTGNKPNPHLLFPPVIGNNKHFGVLFGSNIGFYVWECDNHSLRNEIDAHGRFLFANHQERSFDLRDRQWSRYMETYSSKSQAAEAHRNQDPNSGTPGINVLTTRVRVEPRYTTTFNTGWIYSYCDWLVAEAGYNFFARQGERIEREHGFHNKIRRDQVALKHVDGNGLTTRSRTIAENFEGDKIGFDDFTGINPGDIEPNSAAHPPSISNTFYGAVGCHQEFFDYPTIFSVGGSFEFSHGNGALKRWMVWGKASVDF